MGANLNVWNVKSKDFFNQSSLSGKIKHLLRYAILAPSTHNVQPWLFTIKDSSVVISFDSALNLPQADAKGRDLHITLGCCIENLVITAEYFNVFDRVVYLSKNKKNQVAQIYFKNLDKKTTPNKNHEKLFETITKRVNSRGLFQNKKIKPSIVKEISKLNSFKNLSLHLIQKNDEIAKMSHLTATGLKSAYKRSEFRHEMSGWMNHNLSSRNEGIPGYSLRMPTLLSLIFPTLVRNFDLGERVGKINYVSMTSSSLVCVVTASRDTTENWLNTGRLAERAMLTLQSQNIKTSIFVASVEMGELYKDVQKIIKSKSIPQFVFCAGYMNYQQKQTPRHPLEKKLLS